MISGMVKPYTKLEKAHRISWIIHNGKIPKGIFVLHKCDNRKCVNPRHLWLGTQKENIQDALAKGRMRYPDSKGERNYSHKLKEKDIRKVRSCYEAGVLQTKLAEMFGVCQSSISRIVTHKRWKHI
jgi:hypothetical protein